jgi:hypothetical protein
MAAEKRVRTTLKVGATVFALSAALLLVAPAVFLELLLLPANTELEWSMRMIAITLFALVGNMWSVATRGNETSVLFSAKVMCLAATALGVLTLLIPVELGFFTLVYAGVGFGFGITYLIFLLQKN